MKPAAAEGNRVGSVEHPMHVSLIEGGALAAKRSDRGRARRRATAPLRPSVDYTVRFGAVHGYIEAYGAAAGTAAVRYEVGRDEQSPALIERGRARPADQRVARALQQDLVRQRSSAGPVSTPRNRGCWRRTGGNVVARLRDRG